jgi:hypothetical protein
LEEPATSGQANVLLTTLKMEVAGFILNSDT